MSGYVDKVLGGLLENELALDVYIAVGLTVLFVLGSCSCSLLGVEKSKQEKKRAWIITTFSAGSCFLLSIYACNEAPISWDFRVRTALMGETSLSRFVVRFFRVQAVLDLALGIVFYRAELHYLTSFIHHIAYFLLCNWMLKTNCSLLFIICCLEELPTFFLGLGHLNKDWRNDVPFGISYGTLRVALHTFLCYSVGTFPEPDDRLGVIRFNFALTWFLHTHWFYQWVQQQRRIQQKVKVDGNEMSNSPDQKGKVPSARQSPVLENLNGNGGSRSSSKSSTGSKAKVNNTEKVI